MSQAAPKSQRPTLSLNPQLADNIKNKPRSSTPQSQTEKVDSRSSTPAQQLIIIEAEGGQSPSPKGKRRVSNDSATKVRASPKPKSPVVAEDVGKEKNGTNGAHVEGNGVEKKETTPKNNKKEKDITEKTNGKKEEKKQENALILGEKTQPEMEKLILEPDVPSADSPMPKSIGKSPGRILKYTPGKGRISPFKTAAEQRLQNASTIVNLSTVSEQSIESGSAAPSPIVANDTPIKPPTGRVSGRRNTRPIKEIKMLHPVSANDSASSIKANLGSPVHNESLQTPIISQLIGRKRGGLEHVHDDDILVDSPSKRARIDFSGFLGYVTTPISNLKNRISRIGLTSSTPRALEMENDIADVSSMETEPADKKDVSQAVEASESLVEKEIEDIKAEKTDIEATTTETPTGRSSRCTIM